MAPCGEEQGLFAGATARIENRADDLIGGGLERRLGLADVPGRAAGVRAAKVFAVVGQDVVREKISLSIPETSRTRHWGQSHRILSCPRAWFAVDHSGALFPHVSGIRHTWTQYLERRFAPWSGLRPCAPVLCRSYRLCAGRPRRG